MSENNNTKPIRIKERTWKRLHKFTERTGRTKTWVISKAVDEYLDRKKGEKETPGGQT